MAERNAQPPVRLAKAEWGKDETNQHDLIFAASGKGSTAERAFSDLYLVNGKGPAEKSIKGLLSSQSMWDDLDD